MNMIYRVWKTLINVEVKAFHEWFLNEAVLPPTVHLAIHGDILSGILGGNQDTTKTYHLQNVDAEAKKC